ncbi:MAG: DoxX family protein [Candidatus Rokuibacteriota bacterium]
MHTWQAWGITLLRITLGVIFVMHGYLGLAVIGPAALGEYTTRMGFPPAFATILAWYLILAHTVGGLLLIIGLWTRLAALAQVPIMASAVFLHHLQQGFFMRGIILDAGAGVAIAGGYEYSLLVLVATVALIFLGGGALAIDGFTR